MQVLYCYIICIRCPHNFIRCPHNFISIQDCKCLIFSNNSLLKPELQTESSLQLYPLSVIRGLLAAPAQSTVTVWSIAYAIVYIPHLRSSSLESCSFEQFIWLHNFHYNAPFLKTIVFFIHFIQFVLVPAQVSLMSCCLAHRCCLSFTLLLCSCVFTRFIPILILSLSHNITFGKTKHMFFLKSVMYIM